MKKHILLLPLLILLLTGCQTTRQNYIALIDNSKSVSQETWDKYVGLVTNTILQNMGRFDSFTLLFIDECSMTKSERVYFLNLADIDFSLKGDGMNNAKDSMAVRLRDTIKANINRVYQILKQKREERANCGNYTDIVNAISEASKLLNREENYKSTWDMIRNSFNGTENYNYKNSVILLSDMVNEDKGGLMNFRRIADYSDEQILTKISQLEKSNKFPNLTDCKIFVYGATSTLNFGAKANLQIENTKFFWSNYFKKCGADLVAYSYDTEREIAAHISSERHY
ncbi:MAG: hypothetical protein IT279_08280 [Ignavibacteriaceae bacterium]|nr:hypothetical protein [Ignavibacteriaceae bacterium]